MITLTKAFRFEMAHRLAKGYKGKCANIHGHSWNGEISIICEDLDEQDMGVDYADIGTFLKEMEDFFDHKLALYHRDPLVKVLFPNGMITDELPDNGILLMQLNPTSEAIAIFIYGKALAYFNSRPYLKATVAYVRIKETCTTSCTYTGPDT